MAYKLKAQARSAPLAAVLVLKIVARELVCSTGRMAIFKFNRVMAAEQS